MMISRTCFAGVAMAVVTLVSGAGVTGCGGTGGSGGAVMARADAVDVTYYYLPG